MKNHLLSFFAIAAAVCFVSCAPSTPEYRISQRPGVFENLGAKEKELVRSGEIAKGMSQDAVSLAWGNPSRRAEGFRDGNRMERWDYQGTEPVVTNNIFGGYGSYPYGDYRYGGFGPQISYIPYRKSSVWFVGGRVDEWERLK